jgi:leucyl aminopeptidase
MGAYEFTSFKSATRTTTARELDELIVSAHHDVSGPVERGRVVGRVGQPRRATSRTRPPTTCTPTALAERAREIAAATTRSRSRSWAARRSRPPAWARSPASPGQRRGAAADHAALRRPDATRPRARLVGKAVTFDSGGISIKPGTR